MVRILILGGRMVDNNIIQELEEKDKNEEEGEW